MAPGLEKDIKDISILFKRIIVFETFHDRLLFGRLKLSHEYLRVAFFVALLQSLNTKGSFWRSLTDNSVHQAGVGKGPYVLIKIPAIKPKQELSGWCL